jgi:hypothetical protein
LKVFASDFAIPEYLGQKAAPDGFTAMNRNDRTSPVGMPKEVLAALGADNLKAEFPKGFDEAQARDRREPAHLVTATR